MNTKTKLSRITIDVPEEDHKRFKAFAAVQGKSMRELMIESIQKHLETQKALSSENKTRK